MTRGENNQLEHRRLKKLGTRCCPSRVYSVVNNLDDESKQMVREMGFGSLLGMKKCSLRRDIISWLLDRFNPAEGSLELPGKVIKLNSIIFGNVIGIWDGGEDIVGNQIEGSSNSGSDQISLNELQVKLERGEEREFFIRNFVMFVVGTLLMPTTSLFVVRSIEESLVSLNDVSSVRGKNWASISFRYLIDSIRRFKDRRSEFVCGCIYFLQMYYFHNIKGYIRYVDRQICPTNWWSESECKVLCSWITSIGGLDCVKIMSNYFGIEADNSTKVSLEELKVTNDKVISLSKQVVELKSMLNTMQNQVKDHISRESERIASAINSSVQSYISSAMERGSQGVASVEVGLSDDVGENIIVGKEEKKNFEVIGRELAIDLSGSFEIVSNLPSNDIVVISGQSDEDEKILNISSDGEHNGVVEQNLRRMYNAYIESGGQKIGPFCLKHSMCINDFKIAMYIFDRRLPIREVLVGVGTLNLCRYYFRSLLPQGYVDAQIVEVYSWILSCEEMGKYKASMHCNRILPPFIKKEGKLFERSSSTNHERALPLKSCAKVIVPILDQDEFHWFMGELIVTDKMCVIWDSLYSGGSNLSRYSVMKEVLHYMDKTLDSEIKEAFSNSWSFTDFTIQYKLGIPHQDNGYDCGVYMLKYIKFAIINMNNNYTIITHMERLMIALEVVRSPFNEVCGSVEDAASMYFLDQWSEIRSQEPVASTSRSLRNPRKLGSNGGFTTKKEWRKYWSRLGRKRKNY